MQKLPTHNPSLSFIKENWSGNILNEKQQYINLDGPAEKSFAELLKWQTEKNPLKPAKKKQQTTVDVVTNHHITSNREDGVVWLGHASFLFTLSGKHFITDPVLYNVGPVKRFTPLPCDVDALKQIDFILLSHNHRDHCDQKSMQQLCALNPNAIILTGLNVAITHLPAKHWNRRGLAVINNMLWRSFMIEGSKQKIYFGADSGLGIHFAEIAQLFPGIDIAILGIGAYKPEWFMASAHTSPADALVAFAQLKAKQFIPFHRKQNGVLVSYCKSYIMFSKTDIEQYFSAEKQGSLFFLAVGIVAVIASIILFFVLKTPFFKGTAIPMIIIGLIAGTIGFTIYKRSDEDRIRNVYAYDLNPIELKVKELPRMQKVMKSFKVIIIAEVVFLTAAVFLFFYFRTNAAQQLWSGIGAGLILMAVAVLFLDVAAERRAAIYTKGLEAFVHQKQTP